MATRTHRTDRTSLAALVAPEDLRIGDFVAVLNEIAEYPAIVWCDPGADATDDLVRVQFCATDGGMPLKVKAICLPFVYVEPPVGATQTVDVRRNQLVRLKKRYSKTIWKDLRVKRSRKKRTGKKRRSKNSSGR